MEIIIALIAIILIIAIVKKVIRGYIFRFIIFGFIGSQLLSQFNLGGTFFQALRVVNILSLAHHFIH